MPFLLPSSSRLGYYGGNAGICSHERPSKWTKNVNQGRAPATAGEHPQRATGGRGLLSDRACLGAMAAVVVDAFSAWLCEENGRVAAGRLPWRAARDHRSAGPEVLSQCLRLLLGGGRRSIPLAEVDSPGAVGCGRIAPYGWTAAGSDNLGGCLAVVVSRLATGSDAGIDRLFLPQSAPPRAAGAGVVGFAGGRHDCRDHPVGARRFRGRSGRADRYLFVDF